VSSRIGATLPLAPKSRVRNLRSERTLGFSDAFPDAVVPRPPCCQPLLGHLFGDGQPPGDAVVAGKVFRAVLHAGIFADIDGFSEGFPDDHPSPAG